MSSSLFVPGPAEIAVAFPGGGSGSLQYLGVTVNGAKSRLILHTGNVQNDVAGVDGMPYDMRISGQNIITTMQINQYDPVVMNEVRQRFYGGIQGSIGANQIGSLLLTEGLTMQLMIRSRYAIDKAQFSGFPQGLNVLFAICNGEIGQDYSTKEQTVDLTFFGMMSMSNETLTGVGWNTNVTGFPEPT